MNIKLYPYGIAGDVYDYSFAKSIKVIEDGKTYEIVDQGDRTHWFPVEKYRVEIYPV